MCLGVCDSFSHVYTDAWVIIIYVYVQQLCKYVSLSLFVHGTVMFFSKDSPKSHMTRYGTCVYGSALSVSTVCVNLCHSESSLSR